MSIETNTEQEEVLELSDKDCKAAVIKMLQHAITNALGTNEKIELSAKKSRASEKKVGGIFFKEPNRNFRSGK